MALDPVTAISDLAGKALDKIFPDANQAAQAKAALNAQFAGQEFQLLLAQIQTNQEEAKSEKWWKAGWRPGIGWVCVLILGLSYIPKALVLTGFWAYQCYLIFAHPDVKLPAMPPFPDLGLTDVLGILGTLLGSAYIGKLRTDEKKAGVT